MAICRQRLDARRAALSGPSGPRYAVAPTFGVRVAGSPVEDLHRLRFAASWAVVDEHLALSRWLQAEGQALSDLLHTVIGACAEGGIKPLLVALRRAVFQGKTPGARAWSEELRGSLPADLTTRIAAWVSELDRRKALETRLGEVLAAEKVASTSALRHAVGRRAFRFGLLLGSPTLAEALEAWIDEPSIGPPRDQVLLRAAKYLSRAVAKTSPYASFTVSGLGGWTSSGPASSPTSDLTWRGVPELERGLVLWLWSTLTERPEFREQLRVRVNPTLTETGGQLRFLGAAAGEPIIGMARTKALQRVLDLLRTTPAPTLGSLRRQPESSLVDQLITLGLLELSRPFTDQSPDPLDDVAQWIATATDVPTAGVDGWCEALRKLRTAVRGYSGLTEARARVQELQQIRTLLAQLLTTPAHPPEAALPVKDLLRENAVITHPVLTCGWEQWQPILDDLGALRGFLGVFNPHLPARAEATAFFLDRFSPEAVVAFLDFYRDFHATHPPAEGHDTSGPAMLGLAAARRAAVSALYHSGEDSSGIVRVDPGVLPEIAASWPASVGAPDSICCYAQPLPGPDGPRLVLNRVCTGYGWGITRIQHLITQTGQPGSVPGRLDPAIGDPGVLLVECRAAFGTNLNLRPAAVPYALDYPRTEGGGDPATRVSMTDLHVSYDPVCDRLVLRGRCGTEIRPLALGMLAEHSLPPALLFLIRVFGEPQTALAPDRQLGTAGWHTTPGGLRRRPRLEMGRLVLARAAWSLPAHQLPLRTKGESDAAFLLRVGRWRDQHGIPPQCFAHVITPAASPRRTRSRNKARKPLYLDFANWFLLTAWERSLAQLVDPHSAVIFEEALPGLADAPHYGTHGQRVTEYIIELSTSTS